jgi:hypothetical protein
MGLKGVGIFLWFRISDGVQVWSSQVSACLLIHVSPTPCSPLEPINDLDWTSTPDRQSILAIGFAHQVELLSQQRKTYFDDDPGWAVIWKVQIGRSVWCLWPFTSLH